MLSRILKYLLVLWCVHLIGGGGLAAQSWLTLEIWWTVAHQAPPSMGFSWQEYWSGLPFPPPGDLPNPGTEPGLLHCRQILYPLSHQGSHALPQTQVWQRHGRAHPHMWVWQRCGGPCPHVGEWQRCGRSCPHAEGGGTMCLFSTQHAWGQGTLGRLVGEPPLSITLFSSDASENSLGHCIYVFHPFKGHPATTERFSTWAKHNWDGGRLFSLLRLWKNIPFWATPLEQRGSASVCPPRHVGYVLKRWIPPLLEELCGSIAYRVKVTFFRCGFQSFY